MANIIKIKYKGNLGYLRTLKDVIESFGLIDMTVDEFLDFENADGIKNRQSILEYYSESSLIKMNIANPDGTVNEGVDNSKKIDSSSICPVPVVFFIDSKYVPTSLIITQSNILANNFSVTNPSSKGAFVEHDVFFKKLKRIQATNRDYDGKVGDYSKNRITPSVFIWCKSLNDGEFSSQSVFDLSPFITNLNTNVSSNGGNFNFQLKPIEGIIQCNVDGTTKGVWNIDKSQYLEFNSDVFNSNIIKEHYFKSRIIKEYPTWVSDEKDGSANDSYGKRFQSVSVNKRDFEDKQPIKLQDSIKQWTKMYFENLISENDVVFISFGDPFRKFANGNNQFSSEPSINGISGERTSNVTSYKKLEKTDNFFINHLDLPDGQYEMIGLVDTNSISHTAEDNDISLQINGRDCMKLLIEDGSHFFMKSYSNPDETSSVFNNDKIQGKGDSSNALNVNKNVDRKKSLNRLLDTGMIETLAVAQKRNVDFVLNLLFSTLANIEVCPNDLFDGWRDRRTKFVVVTETTETEPENKIKK